MDSLEKYRTKINSIDKQIAELFEERMNICKEIACYKKDNNLPIFDSAREQQVIQKNSEYISDELLKQYYVDFQKSVMNISKEYQKEIIE